jgi:hypothetical protein
MKRMKPTVYVETTIIRYLTARSSRQPLVGYQQRLTRDWRENESRNFELFVSEAVVQEASAGEPAAARRRLEIIRDLTELRLTDAARNLAKALSQQTPFGEKARVDALHIAIATVNEMSYLLTWNCRHIANATLRHSLSEICHAEGYEIPVICTPPELIGGKPK